LAGDGQRFDTTRLQVTRRTVSLIVNHGSHPRLVACVCAESGSDALRSAG
jgi:hypothetical protein